MASPIMSTSAVKLDHSRDEKSSLHHEMQTHGEDEQTSTNVDAIEYSETPDSHEAASSRQSSFYARGGQKHEFKSYLLDEK
jgi:hypothetical protein